VPRPGVASRQDLLALICQMSNSGTKVLVTLRPHIPLLQHLHGPAIFREVTAHEDDITYLKSKLESEYHLATSLKEKIIDRLSSVAKGMYAPSRSHANSALVFACRTSVEIRPQQIEAQEDEGGVRFRTDRVT